MVLGAAALVLAGCSSSSAPPPTTSHSLGTGLKIEAPPTPATTTTLPAPPQGWTLSSMGARGITALTRTFVTSGGKSITIAEFPLSTTAFHLHVGSQDPPGGASKAPADAGPKTGIYENRLLMGAFNGGFKQNAGAGGVMVNGIVVSPLVNGKAALVIDTDGSIHVGTWGSQVPVPGEKLASVRENLVLLVDNGVATPASNSVDPGIWGSTVGSNPAVARSALGVDAQGNVFFAGSMSALPSDLAQAMVSVHAQRAMQLDINPNWITLGIAPRPGEPMVSQVPGQNHSPAIFTNGWERDFVGVVAKPSRNCSLVFALAPGVGGADPPLVMCGPRHKSGGSTAPAPS